MLGEEELALADYREVLRIHGPPPPWNPDQAALAIWTIRSRRGARAAADRELRRYFAGRKPDLQANWYVYFVDFLLDRRADEAALEAKVQLVEPPSERITYMAGLYYFFSVRRQLAGDKSGALKMLEKAAASNSRGEIQWFESTLRLRIASGKTPSPKKPEAGDWRSELPNLGTPDTAEGGEPTAKGEDEETRKDKEEAAARKKAVEAQAARARNSANGATPAAISTARPSSADWPTRSSTRTGKRRVIKVPLEKLSDEDQKYIRQRTR